MRGVVGAEGAPRGQTTLGARRGRHHAPGRRPRLRLLPGRIAQLRAPTGPSRAASSTSTPALLIVLRENRAFLRRVVRHLVAEGVDQVLDLGSGIPTAGNVHEVAHAGNPGARIVYVDHDPVAVTHSRELLNGDGRTTVLAADILDPEHVLDRAAAAGGLDLHRPVPCSPLLVLHFVPDERRPGEVMAHYLRDAAPGSHLAISQSRSDGIPAAVAGQKLYAREKSLEPMHPRTAEEVTALFGDLTLLPPGVVAAPAWRPDPVEARRGARRRPRRPPGARWCGPEGLSGDGRGGGRGDGRARTVPRRTGGRTDRGRARPRLGAGHRRTPASCRWTVRRSSPSSRASPPISSRRCTPRPSTARCPCASVPPSSTPTSPRPARSSALWRRLGRELGRRHTRRRRAPGPAARRVAAGYARALHDRTRREQERDQRVGLRRPDRRGAGALGQRGPVPDGVRRGRDRHRAGRHRGPGPRGQPGPGRHARLHAEELCAASRSGPSSTPTTCRALWDAVRGAARAATATTSGWTSLLPPATDRVWTDLVLSLIRDADGAPQYMVAMMEDITERHRLQTRLRHQALHDPLTGLPNRTLFFERLDAALARAGQPARRLLPRPRRLQGHQRHARPRRGDRLLQRGRRAGCIAASRRRRTWSPGWAATSSWCWSSSSATRHAGDELVALGAQAALAAVRAPVRLGGHEHHRLGQRRGRRAAAAARRRRADEGGRHHAVLGQGGRPQPAGRCSTPTATAATSAATRCRRGCRTALDPRRVLRGVPAAGPAGRRRGVGRRGAGALATLPPASGSGPDRFIPLAEETGLIVPLGPLGARARPAARPRRGAAADPTAGCSSASTSPPGRCASPAWSTTSPRSSPRPAGRPSGCSWS